MARATSRRSCRSSREFGPHQIAFCTDDRDPDDIVDDGHINGMVRKAVAAGVEPADAIVIATLNPARWHGLRTSAPSRPATRPTCSSCPTSSRSGPSSCSRPAGAVGEIARPDVPEWVRQSVRIAPLGRRLRASRGTAAPMRVIGLVPDQVVTESLVDEPTVVDGEAVADPERDLAKIAVVERHLGDGPRRARLRRAARACGAARSPRRSRTTRTTSSCVGVTDDDMLARGQRARRARRRDRRRRRRPACGGVPAAGRRPVLGRAARRSDRAEPRAAPTRPRSWAGAGRHRS